MRFRNNETARYNLRSQNSSLTPSYIAQNLIDSHFLHHVYNPQGKRETIDSLLKGPHSKIWERSLSNDWGRLAQGNDFGVRATNTIDFIHKHEVPAGKKVTHASFPCDYRPLKEETHRVRITVGGDRLDCTDDTGSPATNLLETKIILNSTISDAQKGARFMTIDIKGHFYSTPMQSPEYMKVHYRHIPQDIRRKYNLDQKVTADGYVCIKIKKGMPGLKQAAILAYQHLKNCLLPFRYYPIPETSGL